MQQDHKRNESVLSATGEVAAGESVPVSQNAGKINKIETQGRFLSALSLFKNPSLDECLAVGYTQVVKGIILAGGLGTRLLPLTKVTNKHLLPVYNQPMIFYPLQKLIKGGIKDIMIVTGGNNAGDFLRLLGNGKDFGLKHLHYTYQEGEGGIAEALALTEEFTEGERIIVILGDNIFKDDITPYIKKYQGQKSGAEILLKEVVNPERFGVAEVVRNKIVGIVEKPKQPKSNLAVTGVYMYDDKVFNIIKTLKPSGRGELEITDVNNAYIKKGNLTYDILPGWWADAGSSFESYFRANTLSRQLRLKDKR